MSRRVWLLVEWVDENNVFPSYEVVNVDTFSYKEIDLQPGKHIFISLKHNNPRRATIIKISDNKHQVKDHKAFLERQDHQVKNVLQLCMRTIKEMKSDQYSRSMSNHVQLNMNVQQSGSPHIVTAKTENSGSDDSDIEVHQNTHQSKMTKYINQTHKTIRYEPNTNYQKKVTQSPTQNQRRRSMMSSTPLPGISVHDNIKLYFDQGTQTDNAWVEPPTTAKLEEIELVVKHLYSRFQSLVMKANNATNGTVEMSENEQKAEVSFVEPNDSGVMPNNIAESGAGNHVVDNNVIMDDVCADQIVEADNESADVKMTVKLEASRTSINENRVRRMSAQTTYSNETVPIGNGHVTVPARLLNEIDWSSHTTATRQLLQAIFPRKVLATHSLTGKQSPAHLNKPAKKLLDPNLVDDVIMTVSTKSGVPKNLVRNAITIKCTDEAKLYRNRQRHRFSRNEKSRENNENVPPALHRSSDES